MSLLFEVLGGLNMAQYYHFRGVEQIRSYFFIFGRSEQGQVATMAMRKWPLLLPISRDGRLLDELALDLTWKVLETGNSAWNDARPSVN